MDVNQQLDINEGVGLVWGKSDNDGPNGGRCYEFVTNVGGDLGACTSAVEWLGSDMAIAVLRDVDGNRRVVGQCFEQFLRPPALSDIPDYPDEANRLAFGAMQDADLAFGPNGGPVLANELEIHGPGLECLILALSDAGPDFLEVLSDNSGGRRGKGSLYPLLPVLPQTLIHRVAKDMRD